MAPEMISWSLLKRLSSVKNLSRQSFMFVFYVPSSLRDETSNLSCHKSTLCLLLVWKTKRAISQSEGHFCVCYQNTSRCVLVGTVFHVHCQMHTLSVSDGQHRSTELKSLLMICLIFVFYFFVAAYGE